MGDDKPTTTEPLPKLEEVDRLSLELAKANKNAARSAAETMIAKNETAELGYRYLILQLYMKYGLDQRDAISEDGTILKGGANLSSK